MDIFFIFQCVIVMLIIFNAIKSFVFLQKENKDSKEEHLKLLLAIGAVVILTILNDILEDNILLLAKWFVLLYASREFYNHLELSYNRHHNKKGA